MHILSRLDPLEIKVDYCPALPCPALPCPALPCPALLPPRMNTLALPCPALPCLAPPLSIPCCPMLGLCQLVCHLLSTAPRFSLLVLKCPSTAVLLPSGEQSSVAYLWGEISADTQQIAATAGNCSLVQSARNMFQNNYANIAGGAVYATDLDSLHLTCMDSTAASVGGGCKGWTNNMVQATTTATGGTVQLQVMPTPCAAWNSAGRREKSPGSSLEPGFSVAGHSKLTWLGNLPGF